MSNNSETVSASFVKDVALMAWAWLGDHPVALAILFFVIGFLIG